jgi:hypothetical protein
MADKPVEILLFDFLKEKFDLAVPDEPLFQIELHDTMHQTITKLRGVRISEANGLLAPGPGGGVGEWDVELIVTCYAKVEGKDKTERQAALQASFDIHRAVAGLLFDDSSLGGRVCDVLLRKWGRGYDVFEGNPYAVVNQPLIMNPSGRGYEE